MVSTLFSVALLGVSLTSAAVIDVRAAAAKPKTLNSTVESGINTECKTCPYSLCPNVKAFGSGDAQVLTCWAEGTSINGDTTWLKTTDNCYITQWDLVEYAGDYTKDLPSCGKIPQKITKKSSRTIYNTECNLSPFFQDRDDHVKMYVPQVPLTVTCYTNNADDTAPVLGNPTWYKTLSNCYVPAAQIEPVDTKGLDNCGPVPFIEKKMREPDAANTKRALAVREPSDLAVVEKRWLYTTQIGFDKGPCTQKAAQGSKAQRTYKYGAYITVQCATYGDTINAENRTIYLLTTDFCYVRDDLTDPELIDDQTRADKYPACELFVDKSV